MYNKIKRDGAYLYELTEWIRREYPINPIDIAPAKRGYFGETWRLKASEGVFFLKLNYSPHRELYANSFHALEHMREHGVDFVSEIVRANDGALFKRWDNAVLGVFRWIYGETVQDEWSTREMHRMLARIYTLPTSGLAVRQEDFAPSSAAVFRRQCALLAADEHETSAQILAVFDKRGGIFTHRGERLEMFSARCKADGVSPLFITHGDAGGNIIRNGGRHSLVDWDDPVLAPPERDAWMGLNSEGALDAFQSAMRGEGIDYALRPDRLAFYCYYSFFWYLTEYLAAYFELRAVGKDWPETLETYFACWIEDEVKAADGII
ncbi:MAG: aminoglycoside phosphotransferase family protein [Oscillospiraceae bacterium]|jgi:Ser/Thr protein kinase RdoA (MazF antagonist)|nr:aminoglycoside phosphotransferase family protein [Oscillospiraceae bacterium]